MRKYESLDHIALSVNEALDIAENPVLKTGEVAVFKIQSPRGDSVSFRCAECLHAELHGPSAVDPAGRFAENVNHGHINIIAVPASDYDSGTESCSGCDRDITHFTAETYEPRNMAAHAELNSSGTPDMFRTELEIGKELENGNHIMYQCPNCLNMEGFRAIMTGWIGIDKEGQWDMETAELMEVVEDETAGLMCCDSCSYTGHNTEFSWELRRYHIYQLQVRSGSSSYVPLSKSVLIPQSADEMQILGALRKVLSPAEMFKPLHQAMRLTDKNIIVHDETMQITLDLRHNYKRPDYMQNLDFTSCGHIAPSDLLADAVCPVCAHSANKGEWTTYSGQEGQLPNSAGTNTAITYCVHPVAYSGQAGGLKEHVMEKAICTIALPANASVPCLINALNSALKHADYPMQGEIRARMFGAGDTEIAICTFDGRYKIYSLQRV